MSGDAMDFDLAQALVDLSISPSSIEQKALASSLEATAGPEHDTPALASIINKIDLDSASSSTSNDIAPKMDNIDSSAETSERISSPIVGLFETSASISPSHAQSNSNGALQPVHTALNPVSTPVRSTDVPQAISLQVTPIKSDVANKSQDVVVILQDACLLHKFSRNIRQRDLDSIVERPERSRAAILGILTAGAHLESVDLPHFDIVHSQRRGSLQDKAIESIHGSIYPQELLKLSQEAAEKLTQSKLEVPENYPYGDLYLGPRSLEAINGCIGAVYDGMDALFAQHYCRSHVCIRPPGHHAAEISPCGFCWINNVHVAIAYAREKYGVKRAAILDFDLHHGDGSQAIAWTLNEQAPNSIGYYSIHDIHSYPCEGGNIEKIREASVSLAAHGHNVHNVHLRPFETASEFENIYHKHYSTIFEKAGEYLKEGFMKGEKTIVCISAGYDASEYESSSMQRHKVSVPTSFYRQFTADAVKLADTFSDGKIFSVMEGGYGDRAIASASCAHMLGLAKAPCRDDIDSSYSLDKLKLLEKVFPAKTKGSRKFARLDASEYAWLHLLEKAYDRHIPYSVPAAESRESKSILDLGKMTLRERKPGVSTPVASAPAGIRLPRRTPRSTPVKAKPSKTPLAPDMPPIPAQQHVPSSSPAIEHVQSEVPQWSCTNPAVAKTDSSRPREEIKPIVQPKVSDIYDFVD